MIIYIIPILNLRQSNAAVSNTTDLIDIFFIM